VYGFRVGGLGYVTDAKSLPPAAVDVLRGVDVLVLNALWFGRPHGSHFNIEEAIEAARGVGAKRTYLTHLTHRVRHAELLERLPEGVLPAHDGLTVEID
jgi:phosphoribosyl 1,2-cyclic phosphate phosphodiesterase